MLGLSSLNHTLFINMDDMTFIPSENPGAFERHLIRKNNNSLFESRTTEVNSDTLREAQEKDHEILKQFMLDFKQTMLKAVEFKPNEDSEVILEIKDSLDKLYATSATIADDQTRIQESIKKFLAIIMQAVRKGAGDDAKALQELDQEDAAREANFSFLASKLAADILDADSPIEDVDLVPTLLSADKEDLALATQLFVNEQIDYVLTEAENLLNKLEVEGHDVKEAAENFVFIEGYKHYLVQQTK
jgi:seryl-tRNA synthetase